MELGDSLLKLLVDVLCPTDEADRAHPKAMRVYGLFSCITYSWVARQAKIVVSAEVQYQLPLAGLRVGDFDLRCLLGVYDPLRLESAGLLDRGEELVTHGLQGARC